ncbi:hypothetical protein [Candidatus Poriferisodalis sp.]|uniref:hypothetical protein n=1 Tax=Candidatus Poriferisodalis sp. TaxID=3101277 RepID=UPI003B011A50
MVQTGNFGVRRVKRHSYTVAVVLIVCCVLLAGSLGSHTAVSALSEGDQSPDDLSGDDAAVVATTHTAYKITFDSNGRFDQALEIAAVMPAGAFVDGHQIDISQRLANAVTDPILEGNPQWFMQLETIPKIGKNVELSGSAVIRYENAAPGSSSAAIDAVRVIEQGNKDTIELPNGIEVSGCKFVSRSSAGRQVTTAFVEIAYDPDTCRRVVELGIVSHAAPASTATDDTDDGDAAAVISNPKPGDSGLPENSATPDATDLDNDGVGKNDFRLEIPDYRAKTRSQVLELAYGLLPATSEVHAQVEVWNQQPQYSPSKSRSWDDWLSATGWRRDSRYTWSDRNSDYIYVGETSGYSNRYFANLVCTGALPIPRSPGTTFARHTVQTIGYANLTVENYVLNYKYGGCSYLLRTSQTNNFWWINRN